MGRDVRGVCSARTAGLELLSRQPVPTLLSLLTPEYQQRMVQQIYHEGVDAAHQWSASYCWPEGFMRQWATGPKPSRIIVTPEIVTFMGSSSGNMWRIVHLNPDFPL